jgi:hypothetical protein
VQPPRLGWKGLGNPAGSKGFKYKGAGTTSDPCKMVLIKEKIVKGICKGGSIRFDPPVTGDAGILLTVGSTPMTYLALWGGDEIKNTAAQLKRKDAPAPPACDCGASDPMEFRFANGVGSGICGNVTDGTLTKNFNCGEIIVGGGNSPVPNSVFQDMVNPVRLKVDQCTGKNLILESMSLAETGSNKQCSDTNCLFGPPLPFILPSTPQSACVYMRVDRPGRGTVQCDSGDASIDMTILGAMFLTGDILPNRCVGGTNPGRTVRQRRDGVSGRRHLHGGPQRPAVPDLQPRHTALQRRRERHGVDGRRRHGSAVHAGRPGRGGIDVPHQPRLHRVHAGVPRRHPNSVRALDGHHGAELVRIKLQPRVFCGFCRNPSTLCFEGDPACAPGTQLHRCSSDDECDTSTFSACQQRSNGAFGPNGASFTTATEIGEAAGSLEDFAPHAGTMSGIFCIAPTYAPIIDASSDLPGPGAVSMQGTMQLSPAGAFLDPVSQP